MAQKKIKALPVLAGQFEVIVFNDKEVRRVFHDNEWHFSVVDVIEAITDSASPSRYWNELRAKLAKEEGCEELFANIEKLKMVATDGKERPTDAANVETLFRIVQSVPSKKAEPIKRWLAKVGYERILEAQNPDIAIKRAILDYKLKGRDDEWINNRVRCLLNREELESEWSRRGIQGKQYGILTNLIHEKTFNIAVQTHKQIKQLGKSHSLRDNMTSDELLFTSLGESATRQIAIKNNAQGLNPNKRAATEGGSLAGRARKEFEDATGSPVVSAANFLPAPKKPKHIPHG